MARKQRVVREAYRAVMQSRDTDRVSLGSLLERAAARYPDRPAVKHLGGTWTYRELNEAANRVAYELRSRGIGKGDAVAVALENRPELLAAVAGVVKLGAVAAMINTNQRRGALLHSLRCCHARACLVGEELWSAVSEIQDELEPDLRKALYFVRDGDGEAPSGAIDLQKVIASAPADNPSSTRTVQMADPCFHIFTSGTTGLPKAAVLSHGRWVKGSVVMGRLCLEAKATDTLYVPLPLYHNQALTVGWGAAVRAGAAIAIRRKLSVSEFWADCRRFGATAIIYIGEIPRYLVNSPPATDDRNHGVKKAAGVGLRADIWKDFKERFGIEEVYEFYGASEMNVAFINVMNLDQTCGFCTAPYAIVEFDVDAAEPVRDARGRMRRVPVGRSGLMLTEVSRRFRYEGYTDADASEKKLFRNVFRTGDVWFNSGDLVRDIGFRHIQFVDRVGDTFRWKSENVSTSEVEGVLNGLPGIEESTVYGVELPGAVGRAGMACIVPSGGPIDLDGVLAKTRAQLPEYAVPVFLRVAESLETTGTFKHRKGELRKQAFDPSRTSDRLYVRFPRANGYCTLTDELFESIQRRERTF